MRLHFISGLPRSGSTLLAAILRQNPRCRAGMSSPLAQIVLRLQEAMSRRTEGAFVIGEARKSALIRGLIEGYCQPAEADGLIFDTSRAWCARLPLIAALFPEARIIAPVRQPAWIMDSIERLLASHPAELSGIFGYGAGGTVYARVAGLAAGNGMVGFALDALREAYYGGLADRLILLDYEALCRRPAESIGLLYDLLGEPRFDHDFERLEYAAEDFDLALGTPGLHTVRGPVAWRPRRTILPPDLFRRFEHAFWRDPAARQPGAATIMYVPA